MTTVADEATATASTPEAEQDAMAALDRVRLPVETLAEAIPHLRRPFTPEAIRFKVQSVFKSKESEPVGCLIVAYIDARLASERLNRVIPGSWSAEYKPVDGSKMMWCRLTVDGVARTDVGESTKGMSKDLVSDALKRAAVQFGVGVSCYALPEIKLFMRDARDRIEIRGSEGKKTIVLTEYGHTTLRVGYAKWLEEHGVKRFGPPLDHGDVVGATIEEDAGIASGEGDGTAPGWDGLSEEQIAEVEALIEVEHKLGPGSLDLATVQLMLNHRPEAVEAWLADTRDVLTQRQEGGEE
jgi:hypothetical protein